MSEVKRKPLTKLQFAQLAVEQEGKCGKCGEKLVFEKMKIRDEHLGQLSITGRNDLANRALWCVPCTKPKDVADAKIRAKLRRMRGENKPKQKKAIQSRGFQKAPDGHSRWPKRKFGS